jgi:hypothetical protein
MFAEKLIAERLILSSLVPNQAKIYNAGAPCGATSVKSRPVERPL